MNVVSDKVEALVQLEYEADCKDHGPLASLHEGYAVLKEEVEEMGEASENIKGFLDGIWRALRVDNEKMAISWAKRAKIHAMHAACEAIQVAAVCKRIADLEVKDGNYPD